MLNVRSASSAAQSGDRTTRARIRDAAIATIAEQGPGAATVRRIASAAGVSPALVIHHYGSMEQLRADCDHFVAAEIRHLKSTAMAAGMGLDIVGAFRDSTVGPLAAYLAAVLVEDSPAVAQLVDEMVADAQAYLDQGVATGMVRPSDDPRGRAVVLSIWSLGALVMHQHLQRLLGVDPTDPGFGRTPASARYIGPAWEVFGTGLMTEEFAERARAALSDLATDEDPNTREDAP